MALVQYNRKRDFSKTKEPKGKADSSRLHRFVIQKHAASRLHYDFRLEMAGTLKSWAVPKGIPYKKGERRLAVEVEDHPVSYIDFEGTIPKGQYGGGTVMVWDYGHYEPSNEHPEKDLSAGKLHFVLHGEKLKGEWYLVRLHDEKNWLLIRSHDDMRPVSKKLDDTSARSGRTMKAIGENGAVWNSNHNQPPARRTDSKARLPAFIEPMKARLAAKPPEGKWIYEIKFDGFRALAFKSGDSTKLLSRNDKDFGKRFPDVLEAVKSLALNDAILDGEIVALDAKGRSSFQLLQAYDLGEEKPAILYYVFDLLHLSGQNLRNRPLAERKELLRTALAGAPKMICYSASLEGDVNKLLKQAARLGLEGLIGKRADSIYEPGRRSGAWIKLKLHHEQEMVIGGFTDPEGSRQHFGSLLIGCYEGKRLLCAGKVGAGFDDALLRSLAARFKSLAATACPFKNLPDKRAGRYGAGITPSEMRRCHWLKPVLVCQVKYTEWTRDEKLRHPVFLGLRDDKAAAEVVREKPE
ncbi:MAG TPA: non-homologous end-joining DNA ligase [Verrucomicrobiae bacterium]|jgi:bifunctional non-homologous end joining protein LigD